MFRSLTNCGVYRCCGITTKPPVQRGICSSLGALYAQNNSTSDFLRTLKSRITYRRSMSPTRVSLGLMDTLVGPGHPLEIPDQSVLRWAS